MYGKFVKYGFCLLAALMVAATSCGMTLEHHCAEKSSGEASSQCHDHGTCAHCDHCAQCWYVHIDSSAKQLCKDFHMPSPNSMQVLHCIVPIMSEEDGGEGTTRPQSTQSSLLLSSKNIGRGVLSQIHKLTL